MLAQLFDAVGLVLVSGHGVCARTCGSAVAAVAAAAFARRLLPVLRSACAAMTLSASRHESRGMQQQPWCCCCSVLYAHCCLGSAHGVHMPVGAVRHSRYGMFFPGSYRAHLLCCAHWPALLLHCAAQHSLLCAAIAA
jgi:hypothetical protein